MAYLEAQEAHASHLTQSEARERIESDSNGRRRPVYTRRALAKMRRKRPGQLEKFIKRAMILVLSGPRERQAFAKRGCEAMGKAL